MGDERRRHFRIRYPNLGRPVLSISGLDYPVSELSEGGVRIVGPIVDDHPPTISGTLKLLHGAELSWTGAWQEPGRGLAGAKLPIRPASSSFVQPSMVTTMEPCLTD